jgi:hypothetical protein
MRMSLALLPVLLAAATPACAQVYATSVTASLPDANGKVPAFNVVPGSAISTWSIGLAQAVLTHGQAYNYCVSLGSGTASGKASVAFSIARGATTIQSATIIAAKDFSVGPNGVWYYCSGYMALPNSPGTATLTGTVSYQATGATKSVKSKVFSSVLLQ